MGIRIDEETLEVRAIELSGSNIGNAPMLPDLLGQVAQVKRLAGRNRPDSDPLCNDVFSFLTRCLIKYDCSTTKRWPVVLVAHR